MTGKRPKLLVISGGVSSVTEAPEHPATDETAPASPRPGSALSRTASPVVLAAALVAVAFTTGGGVDQNVASAGNTWTEIVLMALGAVAVGLGLLRRTPGERRPGWVTAAMMCLLFADTAASIAWSWAPDASWIGASQGLAYLSVFAGVIMLARPCAHGWATVLGALALWSVTLCAWSLLVKVFPSALAPGNQFGRLQAPFGYWNAIALCAAMGLPCCLWLGARRDGNRHLAALAAPALTLLISVLVLSYSRSADAAAAVAAGVWLIAVPLRLRAIAMLLIGAAGAAVLSVWFLTHHGLAGNYVSLAAQDHAGHAFGVVVLVVLVLVSVVGIALSEAMDRTTVGEEMRRRVGAGIVALIVVAVVGAFGAVATSSRGLGGEISYRWHELTNPAATVSSGNASRVFQFGSSRPVYWHEALAVGDGAPLKGVGELGFSIARLQHPLSSETVFQAHSYVFETYADLGEQATRRTAQRIAANELLTNGTASWSSFELTASFSRAAASVLIWKRTWPPTVTKLMIPPLPRKLSHSPTVRTFSRRTSPRIGPSRSRSERLMKSTWQARSSSLLSKRLITDRAPLDLPVLNRFLEQAADVVRPVNADHKWGVRLGKLPRRPIHETSETVDELGLFLELPHLPGPCARAVTAASRHPATNSPRRSARHKRKLGARHGNISHDQSRKRIWRRGNWSVKARERGMGMNTDASFAAAYVPHSIFS